MEEKTIAFNGISNEAILKNFKSLTKICSLMVDGLKIEKRDAEIFKLRVCDNLTFQEIGLKYEISIERVRQITEEVVNYLQMVAKLTGPNIENLNRAYSQVLLLEKENERLRLIVGETEKKQEPILRPEIKGWKWFQ